MDSATDFEHEDDFFASYDGEQRSAAALELEEEAEPPTREQLAHRARFRRPVAIVVSAMSLLSVVALAANGSMQHASQRELVAHYGAAIAAPMPAAAAPAAVPRHTAAPEASSVDVPEALSAFLPEALAAFVVETLATLVPEAFATTTAQALTVPALTINGSAPPLEPSSPDTELSAEPASSPASAFVSVSPHMCLRPLGSDYGPRQ
jgi:hypothetical protein